MLAAHKLRIPQDILHTSTLTPQLHDKPLRTKTLQKHNQVVPKLPHPLTVAENFPFGATQEVNKVNCRNLHMVANHIEGYVGQNTEGRVVFPAGPQF